MEEPNDDLEPEIIEQSALDHFSAILQKAQRLAAEAERQNSRKRKYDGTSKSTQKHYRKARKDLAKKGYPSILDISHP